MTRSFSLRSITFSKIISASCFLLIFLILFVPTTTFTGSLLPIDEWYKYFFVAAILLVVLSRRIFRRETWQELLERKWLVGSLVFFFWLDLLWLFQPESGNDVSDIKYWLIAVGFIFFLWLASPDSWKWIPKGFLLVGLINSCAAIAIWVAHHFNPVYYTEVSSDPTINGTGRGWWYLLGGGIHPVAGLRGPVAINGMADILFWPFMILLGYLAFKQRRGAAILGILIVTLGIFVTYSRSTIIVMGLGIFAFLIIQKWKAIHISLRGVILVIAFLSILSILLLFLLPRSFVGSIFYRFGMWQQAYAYFVDFPQTVWSGGGFPKIGWSPYEVWDTHNMYLFLIVQYGVPGLLLFLGMLTLALREGRNLFSRASPVRVNPHAVAAFCALAGFIIRGMAESQINELDLRVAFIFFLAYAVETFRRGISEPQSPPEPVMA